MMSARIELLGRCSSGFAALSPILDLRVNFLHAMALG
jgi:hypothetical protein